jgi:transposase
LAPLELAQQDKAMTAGAATMTTIMRQWRPVVAAALVLRALTGRGLALARVATVRCHLSLELRRDTQVVVRRWVTTPTAALGSAAAEIGIRPDQQTPEAVAAQQVAPLDMG